MSWREFVRWGWHHEVHPLRPIADDNRIGDLMIQMQNIAGSFNKQAPIPLVHFVDRRARAIEQTERQTSDHTAKWSDIFSRHVEDE